MSWYKRAMPSLREVTPFVDEICQQIKSIDGVKGVYVWGSIVEQAKNPNYPIKDIDIIAETNFDSGDLMAIDNSRYSALRLRPNDLEDEGFNPKAVGFTKQFLSFEKYNVDHWASSNDNKLLHWGSIPDSTEDWADLHAEAEARAKKDTGLTRQDLIKSSDVKRKEWKKAFDQYIAMFLSTKSVGWCPSQHKLADILQRAKKLGG